MKRLTIGAVLVAALVACSAETITEPSGSTFAPAYNEGGEHCATGWLDEEPIGRNFYQGSDGRYCVVPDNG